MPITIGFHCNQLDTSEHVEALFNYAYYNQKLYNNRSIIFFNKDSKNDQNIINKFSNNFKCYDYCVFGYIDIIIIQESIDYFYNMNYNNIFVKNCPNLFHIYNNIDQIPLFHNYKFASMSHSLAVSVNKNIPIVPFMIDIENNNQIKDNLRSFLNIPEDAIVIGRYGAPENFDINTVYEVINEYIDKMDNVYFLFSNTYNFFNINHPKIIFLNLELNKENKIKFISTCNAMIHASSNGSTFGTEIGEFSSLNKPIITTYAMKNQYTNEHIDILKDSAILYKYKEDLINILLNIRYLINLKDNWTKYTDYTPIKVMKQFMKVFIEEYTENEDITLITAFYDIGRENYVLYNRSIYTFINSFLNYLNIDYKMIVFIDDRYIDIILKYYEKSKYKNKTFIPINEEWLCKNIPSWSLLDKETEIMNSEYFKTLLKERIEIFIPETIYPKYTLINHSKIDFVCYAINNLNVNDYCVWTDFGYHHSILLNNTNLFPKTIISLNNINTNKLIFFQYNQFNEDDKNIINLTKSGKMIIQGAYFSGNKENLLKLQTLYKECLKELHDNNITDDDQHIYFRCYLKKPELFTLYGGNSIHNGLGLNIFQ